ncbi:MAG: peroxiredoxin [Pseudomonadota bacterium]
MTINVGDKLPEATFMTMGDEGPAAMTTGALTADKKVVVFAVPGAFTPTCNNNHLPGFVEHADEMREKGVDDIAVIAVNDVFVMDAWSGVTGGAAGIKFLADPDAAFAKAIGMDLDLTAHGLGVRSKRYAMVLDNGTVTTFNLEDNPGQAVDSSAAKLLESL